MKKLLILLVLLVAVMLIPSAAQASHPCFSDSTGCLHWPDGNRATWPRTSVNFVPDASTPAGYWTNSIPAAIQYINSAQNKLYYTQSAPQSGVCGAYYVERRVVMCVANFNHSCSGTFAWIGCMSYWFRWEWNGSAWIQSNHLFSSQIQFDSVTTSVEGNPWQWSAYAMKVSICHETTHTAGQGHTANAPDNSSCLKNPMICHNQACTSGQTVEYPGAHVGGTINSGHNHTDYAYGDLSYKEAVGNAEFLRRLKGAKIVQNGPDKGARIIVLKVGESARSFPAPNALFSRFIVIQEGKARALVVAKGPNGLPVIRHSMAKDHN